MYLKKIPIGDRERSFHQTVNDLVVADIRLNHPVVLERQVPDKQTASVPERQTSLHATKCAFVC